MKENKVATIYDVAHKANVSTATVSRVFNKSPLVTKKTISHVLEVAKSLNFVPSASARGLSGGKQETIGIILPVLYGNFFSEFVYSIQILSQEIGYDIVIAGQSGPKENLFATIKKLSTKIDGLILMFHDKDIKKELCLRFPNLPCILLSRFSKYKDFVDLSLDNFAGAKMATEHLYSQGNYKIALIKGEEGNIDALERTNGFLSSSQELDISHENIEILDGTFRQLSGYNAAEELFSKRRDITAIFSSNDAMALGALNWLHRNGINVPDDLSICGFDNIEFAQMSIPPLSSISLKPSVLGKTAFELIIDQIVQKKIDPYPKGIVISPELNIRESSLFNRK